MFTINDKTYVYIPLQYNMSWLGEKDKLDKSLLKKDFLAELKDFIKEEMIYILDFNNLDSIGDRGFKEFFKEIIRKNKSVILANVKTKSTLDNAIRYEIVEIGAYGSKKLYSSEGIENYVLGTSRIDDFKKDTISKIKVDFLNKMITQYCLETNYQYLVSSGVYSNMQINMKKMFFYPEELEYIIYLLWNNMRIENIHGIIATSKNGVALASILGGILGYDVLYFNIGQMFEETNNCVPYVKAGGRYIHVYDVICLGSETKVLNALVKTQGGYVVKSVGCVCLLDLEVVAKKNKYSSMKNVTCLLGQKELMKEYKIFLKEPKGEADGKL